MTSLAFKPKQTDLISISVLELKKFSSIDYTTALSDNTTGQSEMGCLDDRFSGTSRNWADQDSKYD